MAVIHVKNGSHFALILRAQIAEAKMELSDTLSKGIEKRLGGKVTVIRDETGNRLVQLPSNEKDYESDKKVSAETARAIESIAGSISNVIELTAKLKG
jgi:hypothetical protein